MGRRAHVDQHACTPGCLSAAVDPDYGWQCARHAKPSFVCVPAALRCEPACEQSCRNIKIDAAAKVGTPHLIIWGVRGENPLIFPIIWEIDCHFVINVTTDGKKGNVVKRSPSFVLIMIFLS